MRTETGAQSWNPRRLYPSLALGSCVVSRLECAVKRCLRFCSSPAGSRRDRHLRDGDAFCGRSPRCVICLSRLVGVVCAPAAPGRGPLISWPVLPLALLPCIHFMMITYLLATFLGLYSVRRNTFRIGIIRYIISRSVIVSSYGTWSIRSRFRRRALLSLWV